LPGDASDTFCEVLAAPLDQPVGVHEHDVAGVEADRFCVPRVGAVLDQAQGRASGGRRDLDRAGFGGQWERGAKGVEIRASGRQDLSRAQRTFQGPYHLESTYLEKLQQPSLRASTLIIGCSSCL
jgi:hypothetical protein